MDVRRRSLALAIAFLGLLGFHLWLLQRMVRAGNAFLSILLAIAVSLFVWRIIHYANRYRSHTAGAAPVPPGVEMRRILVYTPVLAGLIVLKVWLTTLMWAAGEIAFAVVLVGAVAVLAIRIGLYARRWVQLTRTAAAETR